MTRNFHNTLVGISVLPALLVMPAFADTVTERAVISQNTTYTNLVAENIASTVANNGGVFYMQDVPNVVLDFDGITVFQNNSLNNGGMGGAIGNGWLSSTTGAGFTQGGKIVFNGATTFSGNSTNNNNGGGAIFNYGLGNATNPDIIFYDSVNFAGNSVTESMNGVYAGGGAINHRGGMIVFNSDATFSENESASQGGAIMAAGDMIFNGAANFNENTAGKSGGALAIMGGNTTFVDAATFTNNSAAGASAIYIGESADTVTFRDTASFSGNTGVGTLLNNVSGATVVFDNGATFNSNTNSANGALVNTGTVMVGDGDFIFTNNNGANGGGLKNSGTVNVDTSGNILFRNNNTSGTAGALDNGGAIILDASNVSFANNTAAAGYGGAIFNAGDLTIGGANNTFTGNIAQDTSTTKSGGGAIHNRGNTNESTLIIGTNESTNTFTSNRSNAYGGAIVSRAFDGAGQNSDITINGTTTFANNQSVLDGGAIWNFVAPSNGTTGTSVIVFNGDTAFKNNSAGGMGGAIYNNDTITFNGVTTFSDNTSNGAANDIHNDGTINFNGDTTLAGGINGTGTLNIASGTTFNIGTSDLTQGTINLDGTMLATLRAGENAQINISNANGFTGNGILKLSFDSAGTYKVFGNEAFANIDISNPVFDLVWNGGDVTATTKSVDEIASQNNLTMDAARVVSGASDSWGAGLGDLSVLFQEKLSSGTSADIAAVERAATAINPEKASVIQSVGVSYQNTIASMVTGRILAPGIGRAGGDTRVDFGGIWAQGLYNKSKLNDVFNGYTRGGAVGFDGTINEVWTLGAGYMYSHSDISAQTRNTEIDSSTMFIYGQYKPSSWYANAIVNYTMSDYSENGNALGVPVSADYDVDVFGGRIATGYDFIGGLTPEIAMQYMHINASDYRNSLGVWNHFGDADYLTASIGTRYEFGWVMNNGIVLRPQMHYAAKYDLISDDHTATVTMPGVNAYVINGEKLSRVANELGVALAMNYGALEMSLNYDIEARSNYTSQTGRLKFRYEF